ncbi:uncharacterized protein CANTADRAFT_24908 [Suhomyces tanzawaensis NRRL Y-17324]|uniref:PCI domain-containing protein n=1 Tax=Suhomyces tanzawaensis NRRL Y-17324 TaxID=984487 RepID=A0A1E4SSH7_9ASCO|nr:uncharacterized protein CANTADRAFT_24908 [Suhomyces tanzawaensis NRRL Y-17324]ODV82367.1 hypothetical protein CANTADRAFT_24908 [Suhomyces tanzawaensis NRRL Y-17324]
MSDEEFYSEESYEFEFEEDEDDEDVEQIEVDESGDKQEEEDGIEQKYYSAKALKFDDIDAAIGSFKGLIEQFSSESDLETFEWVFKSYKQLIKIFFNATKYNETLEYLENLLRVLPRVSYNYGSDSLSRIINNYSLSNDQAFVQRLYDTILEFLSNSKVAQGSNYDRLWIKISLSQLTILLGNGEYDACSKLIHAINQKFSEVPKQIKKSYSLDLIALEIQFYSEQRGSINLSKLNQLYRKSLESTTTVTHPKILGIIRECGGKIQFYRGNYEKARLEFYESFNNYDEAGSSLKKKVLKYLILCSLLTENQFNPFESQETSTYASLPEYSNLLLLIKAYDSSDVSKFSEAVHKIQQERDPMIKDDLIVLAIDQVSKNLVKKSILNLLKAYKTLRFEYVRNKFKISQDDFEELLVKLMVSGKLEKIKVDFVREVIISQDASEPVFPPNLSTKDIHVNMRLNEHLSMGTLAPLNDEDRMEVDETILENLNQAASSIAHSSLSLFNHQYVDRSEGFHQEISDAAPKNKLGELRNMTKLLFITEEPVTESDWLKIIDDWFKALQTSIPEAVKSEMSQKDQVEFRQRNENVINNLPAKTKKDDAELNTGILNPIEDKDDAEVDENEFDVEVHKVDMLASWKKELDEYYTNLTKIPS